MISWSEFHSKPFEHKIKLLYEQGTFVTAIRYYGYKVNLYLLDNFYVEVFVNHKLAAIEKIALLDDHHSRMKFYVDQIKLPGELIVHG